MDSISRLSFFKRLGAAGAVALFPRIVSAYPAVRKEPEQEFLTVAHLTDIHMHPGRVPEAGFAACLERVNSLVPAPAFIINGGDSIMNSAVNISRSRISKEWQSYHSVMSATNLLSVVSCIGNHDFHGWMRPGSDHSDAKERAMEQYKIPGRYYSFTRNSWKFIVLDSIHGKKSIPGYCG